MHFLIAKSKHDCTRFPLYRPSINEERFPGKSRVKHREFNLLIYLIAY